jgi:hypothetical protein
VEALFAAVDVGGLISSAIAVLMVAVTIPLAFLSYKVAERIINHSSPYKPDGSYSNHRGGPDNHYSGGVSGGQSFGVKKGKYSDSYGP